MKTVMVMAQAIPGMTLNPSDFQGRVASLFSPFRRFDAKGGEVVLLGLLRDLHGWEQAYAFTISLACSHLSYFHLNNLLCYLCV